MLFNEEENDSDERSAGNIKNLNSHRLRCLPAFLLRIIGVARALWFSSACCTAMLALLLAISPAVLAQQDTKGAAEHSANSEQAPPSTQEDASPFGRMEWFQRQRAFPLGFIPAGARDQALNQKAAMRANQNRTHDLFGAALPAQTPFTAAWFPIGPQPTLPSPGSSTGSFGNTSGRVSAIAIDPTDATGNTVFIGGAQGGVWRTTDGGVTWHALTDAQPSLAMGALAIAIDPANNLDANHRVIYAGTGEQAIGLDEYYGAGLLRSLDGGTIWAQTCQGTAFTNPSCPFVGPFSDTFVPGGGARIGSLGVNPANPDLLLAGVEIYTSSSIGGQVAQPGIYCTNNAGAAWSRISPAGLTTTAMASQVFFTSSTTAYAAISGYDGDPTNGIYLSHNASLTCSAQTWTRVPGAGLPLQSSMGQIELASSPGNPNLLYAAIANANSSSNTLLGVYKTIDGGSNWTQLTAIPDFCAQKCWYDMVIGVDPADATGNTVFFGGGGYGTPAGTTLLRTTDGGQSFGDVTAVGDGTILHVDHHAIAFTPAGSKIYVGNDGGLWNSTSAANPSVTPGSQTWNDLNNGLALTQFNPGLSIHPANSALAFAGTEGNGTQQYQDFVSPSTWANTNTCTDGAYTVVDPHEQTSVYLSCTGTSGQPEIYKSTFAGQQAAFALLASSSTIGNQLGGNSQDPLDVFPPLVVDPGLAEHLYYGTYRLFETTNGAGTWNAVSGDLTSGGLANGFALTSIAFAPLPGGAYNIYTGADDGTVELALNVTAGSNITARNISAGLPLRTLTKVITDSSDTSGMTAYAAFSGFAVDQSISGSTVDLKGHIFRTANGGANWTDISCQTADCAAPLTTDLPDTPVNDIVIDPDDPAHKTLYAATDIGVFVTVNGGTSWAELGTGLPNVAVLSLALHEPSRTLRAATHGRSAWDYPLPALAGTSPFALSSLSVPDAAAGSQTTLALTLTGRGFTSNSTVLWNGSSQGITVANLQAPNSIQVNVAVSRLAQAGVISVQVADPAYAPNTTNSLPFDLTATAPALTSVTPASASAGSAAVQIAVSGTNFVQGATIPAGSIVTVNEGTAANDNTAGVTTTQVSAATNPQTITATLSSTLLQYGAEFTIGVTNPPPGGGSAAHELLFTVNSAGPPMNDSIANAGVVTTALFSRTVDNFAATADPTDPAPSCAASSNNPSGKSVWWMYTAGAAGQVTANTIGSAYDTVLDVFTGTPGNLVEVSSGCNNNVSNTDVQSQVTIGVASGTTYYFLVTVFDTTLCPPSGTLVNECGGKTVFNFSGPTPAGLAASPNVATITAGGSMTFAINTLAPPLSGQVSFSLAGCPPVSTCTFTSTTVTAGASNTLTVATTANSVITPVPGLRRWPPFIATRFPKALKSFVMMLVSMLLIFLALKRGKRHLPAHVSLSILLLFMGAFMLSCGSGTASDATTLPGTTAGAYPLVITATGSGNTTATTTVNITVD